MNLPHLIWLALFLGLTACSAPDPLERPNFLLIMCDDLGFSDLGSYGGEIPTPNLDRLAREGMQFREFYNNSKCTETRASLLSGLYYQQTDNLKRTDHPVLPEILKAAGYKTLMSGKWHLPATPRQRGFERFFGFLGGAINFFTGEDFSSGENLMRLNDEPFVPPAGFYATDAITDYAINFLQESENEEERPFFLYLAYNAPHFPLHAPAEEIEKHRGAFRDGWDSLREQRLERQRSSGLAKTSTRLSTRDPMVPEWTQLSQQEQDAESHLMETYAAMVTRMDSQIGRLLAYLESTGELDNTMVLFFSDNGACPYRFNRTPDLPPGGSESYRTYDSEWANLSNSPFRLYKQWAHEGGISSPLLARFPRLIPAETKAEGIGHVIDIVPTILDLAQLEITPPPGNLPFEGQSLVPVLRGMRQLDDRSLFWEFRGHHAVRSGKWKLVAESGGDWELYDLSTDRIETDNLAAKQPDRVEKMASLYDRWADRVGALSHQKCQLKGPSTQPR